MSANLRAYEDYLYYIPEKERETLREALYVEEKEDSGMVKPLIRQTNRRDATIRSQSRPLEEDKTGLKTFENGFERLKSV